MKKLFLLSICAGLGASAFAQSSSRQFHLGQANAVIPASAGYTIGRITGVGSVDTLTNWTGTDTLALYTAGVTDDTGYCAGTDIYGDSAFAERYDFSIADSSLQVIGVVALFGGTVSPASTNHVNFHVWSEGAPVALSTTLYESGFPNNILASQSVPFVNLGISTTFGGQDTAKIFMFSTPTGYIGNTASEGSFFVGYSMTYTFGNGDTIGLYSNISGERSSAEYFVVGADTVINNVNATEYNDGTGWHDNATDNFGLYYNYFMFPIVKVGASLSVSGITKNNLTFFGNYPNPASDMTNIKLSLATGTDVTVTIMDMAGRTVNTFTANNLAAGVNVIPVNTSALPSGDYIYTVRTAANDGMAGKMTIIK